MPTSSHRTFAATLLVALAAAQHARAQQVSEGADGAADAEQRPASRAAATPHEAARASADDAAPSGFAPATELLGLELHAADGRAVAQLDDLAFDDGGRLIALVVHTHTDGALMALPPALVEPVDADGTARDGVSPTRGSHDTAARDARDSASPDTNAARDSGRRAPSRLRLTADAEAFASAPALRLDAAARRLSHAALAPAFAHFGRALRAPAAPAAEDADAAHLAGAFLARDVIDPDGVTLGLVTDLAVALERERVLYAVLQQLDASGKRFAVPITSLESAGDALRLAVPAARLAQLDGFDAWPAVADADLHGELPERRPLEALDGVTGDVREDH